MMNRPGGGEESCANVAGLGESRHPVIGVVITFDVVDEVTIHVVDPAIGEDSDIKLGAHCLVVPVLVIGALFGAADADECRGDAGQ